MGITTMGFWTALATAGVVMVLVGVLRWSWRHEGHALVVAGLVLAALATPVAVWDARLQHRLERAVRPVVEVPGLRVACEDPLFGEYRIDVPDLVVRSGDQGATRGTVWLDGSVCRALARYPVRADREAARAVQLLTTGGREVAGERNPAAAACWALQRFPEVAVALGATPEVARARQRTLARGLTTTAACHEHGPWDLTPTDGVFP